MWFAMLASRSPCKIQFCKTIRNEFTDCTWRRMAKSWGITEPNSSVSLFSLFFRIWETLVTGATLMHKHVFMHLPAWWPPEAVGKKAQSLATVFIIIFVFPSPRPIPCVNKKFMNSDGHQITLIFKNRLICSIRYNALLIDLEPVRKS